MAGPDDRDDAPARPAPGRRAGPPAAAASGRPCCAACGFGDLRALRRVRLADGPVTLCENHAAIARGRELTLAALVTAARPPGERRRAERRRSAPRRVAARQLLVPGTDRRAPRERRGTRG